MLEKELEIEQWAKGKHSLLAANAIRYASLLNPVTEMFQGLKKRILYKYRFKTPDLPSWFALYQSEINILEAIDRLITFKAGNKSGQSDFDEKMIFVMRTMTSTLNSNAPKLMDLSNPDEINKLCKDLLKVTVNDVKQELSETPVNPVTVESNKNFILANEMELSFYILVLYPCLVLYQTFPRIMYRKAIEGDTDALEKLLRLDSRLLYEPLIAKQLDIINGKKFTSYEKLIKASVESPKPKISRKRILYAFAGFISASATVMNLPLTEPDIRDLFNSYSRDMNGTDDDDIPLAPEVFYQAIRRARKNWIDAFEALNPYKKK